MNGPAPAARLAPAYSYAATLVSVYDGDSITVMVDLGMHVSVRTRLRLLGIDAPEMGTPEGRAARDHLRALLGAARLVVRTYRDPGDKYGRWLALVEADGVNVNDAMVAGGHARAYDGGAR